MAKVTIDKILGEPLLHSHSIADITDLTNPLQFKGTISLASDFPTSSDVQNGWFYKVTADVTDNDATKTNTGQSFQSYDEIVWNGTDWTVVGNTPSTNHDSLSGLQGGTVGEYYHLTSAENTFVGLANNLVTIDGNFFGINNQNPESILDITGDNFPVGRITRSVTSTYGTSAGLSIKAKTTDNMANDFGSGIVFSIEDSSGVENNIARIGAVRSNNSDTSGKIYFDVNSALSRKVVIDENGYLGIGTENPVKELHSVRGDGGTPSLGSQIGLFQNNLNSTDNAIFAIIAGDSGSGLTTVAGFQFGDKFAINKGLLYYFNHNDSLYLAANGSTTSGMTFTSTNDVGIGTSTPSGKFEVLGTGFPTVKCTRSVVGSTTGIASAFLLKTQTTGNMTDGFGGGFVYSIQDSAGTENYILRIGAYRDGADNRGKLFIDFDSTLTRKFALDRLGRMSFGHENPTAQAHFSAGTASAGTAPIKLTSGTNLGTPETGAIEYNGTNLFFTRSGTTRETVGTIVTKTDTGDTTGAEGLFQINTFDNTFKIYADGAWRTITTW